LLINVDVKSLEIFVAASLSRDSVLMQELWDVHNGITETDTHQKNQDDLNLPSRVIAKRFIFKLLYGASAYGYKHDSDFISVKYSQDDWQEVIDKFYSKYSGIAKWHQQLLLEAQTNGCITIPSGRYFPIVPDITKRESWPLTIIKNYPVLELIFLPTLASASVLYLGGQRRVPALSTETMNACFLASVHSLGLARFFVGFFLDFNHTLSKICTIYPFLVHTLSCL